MTNSVDLDEVARYESPHQDQRCFQILFSSRVVKELKGIKNKCKKFRTVHFRMYRFKLLLAVYATFKKVQQYEY